VRLGSRMRGPEGVPVGRVRRISIDNVVCYNADPQRGCVISGIPGHDIEGLSLSNIKIYFKDGGTMAQAATRPAERQTAYPHPGMFGDILAYAFFVRHVRGVIWYQGESNAPHPAEYADVMSALITSWRAAWKQGDFPFLQVQLAAYDFTNAIEIQAGEIGGGWPRVRAAQSEVASSLPNVGAAVTIDVGDTKNIHPRRKAEVGHRLALLARKIACHESIEYTGPAFKSLEINQSKAVITFDHATGLQSSTEKLEGFELAGEDNHFVRANAVVESDHVTVTSDAVPHPVAVRYAWDDDPRCTLFNADHLSAAPFSTK
jgi:sialate O-acetylesterase